MRHIIRGELTPIERRAAEKALNNHQQRYGDHARRKTTETYRVKVGEIIVAVEIANRTASYVATVMNHHRSLQNMCGAPA